MQQNTSHLTDNAVSRATSFRHKRLSSQLFNIISQTANTNSAVVTNKRARSHIGSESITQDLHYDTEDIIYDPAIVTLVIAILFQAQRP